MSVLGGEADVVDAAAQVSHQHCRDNANLAWLEYRQQFNSGAPALDLLISSDFPAHATRIGFHNRGCKLPETPPGRSGPGGGADVSAKAAEGLLVAMTGTKSLCEESKVVPDWPVRTPRTRYPGPGFHVDRNQSVEGTEKGLVSVHTFQIASFGKTTQSS